MKAVPAGTMAVQVEMGAVQAQMKTVQESSRESRQSRNRMLPVRVPEDEAGRRRPPRTQDQSCFPQELPQPENY